MFPNFAACLELNHSCNEEREERSGELSAQSQERTKNHVCECHRQQFQCTAHTWPSEGAHSPNYLGDSWQSVLALTCNAVCSLEMLLMAQKLSPCPCWKYQRRAEPSPVTETGLLVSPAAAFRKTPHIFAP